MSHTSYGGWTDNLRVDAYVSRHFAVQEKDDPFMSDVPLVILYTGSNNLLFVVGNEFT